MNTVGSTVVFGSPWREISVGCGATALRGKRFAPALVVFVIVVTRGWGFCLAKHRVVVCGGVAKQQPTCSARVDPFRTAKNITH